jgi:colanic acid biosynthesis glycosyl transferase WcaI
MRILILNRVEPPQPGATGRLLSELVTHLRKANHQVGTITLGQLWHTTQPNIFLYLFSWFFLGFRTLIATRADRIIIMSDPPMLFLWAPLLKLRHGKIIYWCQDCYPDLFPVIGTPMPTMLLEILRQLKCWALQAVDQTIAIGDEMAARLQKYTTRIVVQSNWAELDISKNEISLAEPMTIIYAGTIGRVHPVDAIVTAIQSCRDLPVKFMLMTSGKYQSVLQEKLAAQSNVTFLKPQPWERAKRILSMSHLHYVALKKDAGGLALPVKTFSALQNGRPYIFIGPAETTPARLIAAHDCGIALLPENAVQLASILATYIDAAGRPNQAWQDMMRRANAIDLPVGPSAIAEIIMAG